MSGRAPRLLAISDRRGLGADFDAWLGGLGAAGVDAVQLREKDLSDRRLYELVRRARALLPPSTRLLVNGRADVALAAGADGVHLAAAGLPAGALRQRFGADLLLGVSTHHPTEVEAAAAAGADYVLFGPIYPTPSKEGYGPPQGLDRLRLACALRTPVLAVGGVTIGRLAELAAAGAAGAAGIRCFFDVDHLPALVAEAARSFCR